MSNPKTGYICIDPLTYFYFIGLLVQEDHIPEPLCTDDIFQLTRTPGTELNNIFVSKIQLIMEIGIQSYIMLIDILHSGLVNETYDLDEINSYDMLDDLMRFMYCTKYMYNINPNNPLGIVPNKHHVVDENDEKCVIYQSKKANLIRSDKTIKFDPRVFDTMVEELNNEFLVNTSIQTFVPVSLALQDKIQELAIARSELKQPITYITQFIIMNTIRYHNEFNRFPFIPYELTQLMLSQASSTLHE